MPAIGVRLEGFEYDRTADFLSIRVVRPADPSNVYETTRVALEVEMGPELRTLVETTVQLLEDTLSSDCEAARSSVIRYHVGRRRGTGRPGRSR